MRNFKPVLLQKDDFEVTSNFMTAWTEDIRVIFHYNNDTISIINRKTGETEDVQYSKIRSFEELLMKVQATVVKMTDDVFDIGKGKSICECLMNYQSIITPYVDAMEIVYVDIPDTIRVQHKELRLMRLCPVCKFGQLEQDYDYNYCEDCYHADAEGQCNRIYDDWIQLESEHYITCRGIWNMYTDGSSKYTKFWLLEESPTDFDEIIAGMMELDENTVVKIDGIDDCTSNTVEWLSIYLKDRIKVLKW